MQTMSTLLMPTPAIAVGAAPPPPQPPTQMTMGVHKPPEAKLLGIHPAAAVVAAVAHIQQHPHQQHPHQLQQYSGQHPLQQQQQQQQQQQEQQMIITQHYQQQQKQLTISSKPEQYHIFVGDLSAEIDSQQLRDAFAPFGEISDCRVVRDPQTLKTKGYGFVSFIKKSEAETAITAMNGQWLGSRPIRTNWATRKPPNTKPDAHSKPLTFDEVYNQSNPSNCTVYCGGMNGTLAGLLSEEILQKTFSPFGIIQEIRVFKDKGYAFVRYSTKEAAAHAIVTLHNTEINQQLVKCAWGKESGEPLHMAVLASQAIGHEFPFGSAVAAAYGQHVTGYWYPSAATVYQNAAASPAAPTTANALQPTQYLQGIQGYTTLGQFGGYQQSFMGMGVQVPATWPRMPAQAALAATTAPQITQATQVNTPMPQTAGVVAYPMQQYQINSQITEDEWLTPRFLV